MCTWFKSVEVGRSKLFSFPFFFFTSNYVLCYCDWPVAMTAVHTEILILLIEECFYFELTWMFWWSIIVMWNESHLAYTRFIFHLVRVSLAVGWALCPLSLYVNGKIQLRKNRTILLNSEGVMGIICVKTSYYVPGPARGRICETA